jgi:MoaA/NifB/PqqE/SkfB family radical SAM enzyme
MGAVVSGLPWLLSNVGIAASQLMPASPFANGRAAFRSLTAIDRALLQSQSAAEAAAILDATKHQLCESLRTRFSPVEAQALTLKILNLFLSRYHFRARDAVLLSHPFGIVVDPSNMCQLACPGCVHSERSELVQLFDWPKGTLSESRFAALLQLYGPRALAVYFCDYGEPLLNLSTPRLIRMAKSYLLSAALSTSLSVRRFDPEAYVASGLDVMNLSIDGATQNVYELFRRKGNLQLVLDNVTRLVEAKRKQGKRTPLLSWNFLAFDHNVHEIELAERTARKLGVNYFRVVNPFDVGWDDPEIRPAKRQEYVKRLDRTSIANPPENWNPFPGELEAGAFAAALERPFNAGQHAMAPSATSTATIHAGAGHTCHWLYKNIVVDATGRVIPCCGAPTPDQALIFGNLDATDGDPFNSRKYLQARIHFTGAAQADDNSPQCTRCDWDQTKVAIGSQEIRRYFRAADTWFFDRQSRQLLSAW